MFYRGGGRVSHDACFLALYQQLKLVPGLQLHRMMSPKVDDIVKLFNTVLADLSIEEARNHSGAGAAYHCNA